MRRRIRFQMIKDKRRRGCVFISSSSSRQSSSPLTPSVFLVVSSFFFVYLYLFFNREIFINENERGYICLYEETSVPKMKEEEKRLLLLYK